MNFTEVLSHHGKNTKEDHWEKQPDISTADAPIRLLALTAIWESSPSQLNRLPASPYYLESVVTDLKERATRTYYRDKLRGYRLGVRAKTGC
ncbi:MAG: hypothetical protein ACLRJV_17460 [Eubacteriales bacterium]